MSGGMPRSNLSKKSIGKKLTKRRKEAARRENKASERILHAKDGFKKPKSLIETKNKTAAADESIKRKERKIVDNIRHETGSIILLHEAKVRIDPITSLSDYTSTKAIKDGSIPKPPMSGVKIRELVLSIRFKPLPKPNDPKRFIPYPQLE